MTFQFKQNIRSGIFWIGSFKVAGQILLWINTIIIARFLNPADYGLAGMAILVTSFVLLVGSFGFGASIIQRKDLQSAHLHSLFWITLGIGLFISVLVYAISPLVARFFDSPPVAPLLQLSSAALFFSIVSEIPYSLLIKNLRYKSAGAVDLFSNLTANIMVLIFAVRGLGAYSLVLGSVILGFLKLILSCALSRWAPRLQFQGRGLRAFIRFGGAIVASRILWYLYDNADYMILAKRLGKVPFGLYSFAFNLASMPTNKVHPILSPVLYSSFSMIQDDRGQIRERYLAIIQVSFAFYAMIYCGMFWVSREFVSLFLGAKWLPIILVMQILLAVQPFRAIGSFSATLIDALGRPSVGAVNQLILCAIMIPAFLVGSRWGMIGVSAMWCLAYPIAFIIMVARIMKVADIPLRDYFRQLLPGLRLVAFASSALYAFSVILPHMLSNGTRHEWVSLIGKMALGSASYAFVLLRFERRLLEMALRFLRYKP